MKTNKTLALIFGLLFLLLNLSGLKKTYSKIKTSSKANLNIDKKNRITVMTFNTENLFDTEDDPGKDDETFLPLRFKKNNTSILNKCQRMNSKWMQECKKLDWNDKLLKSKMSRLADVILKSHKGIGPDIVVLQEVENLRVLEKLRMDFLNNYYPLKSVLIEGPDRRGIDVAILSKIPLADSPKLHLLKFKDTMSFKKHKFPVTRGILETKFILSDQTELYMFGVHFPSQGTVTEARKQALKQLIELMDDKPKNSFVIAGGDFNITAYEEKKHNLFQNLNSKFKVSHLVGCKGCLGTNYFHPRRSWSFLDVLIFSKNASNWHLDPESVRVYNTNLYQNNKWGSPKKFDLGKHQEGVSDHWPLLADIFLN